MKVNLPKIFVQIASYRDPECQWTIKDLFEKAAHPERIFVGICWQFDKELDKNCFEIPYSHPQQVRVVEYDYRDARGANWARVEASKLWKGEEYVYFSEPHIRYVQNWDLHLLRMLEECDSEKPILTSIHSSYTIPEKLAAPIVGTLSYLQFHPNGVLLLNVHHTPNDMIPNKPSLSNVALVSSLFADAKILNEVPQDPYIYFEGDECSYSARLWTHGWDLFCANYPLTYHLHDRSTRPLHWDDCKEEHHKLSALSAARFRFLFKMQNKAADEEIREIAKFGFGKTRSLKEYEKFAGVNFKKREIYSQEKWEIAKNGSKTLSCPKIIQDSILAELKSWILECIALKVSADHIISCCMERGVSKIDATRYYKKLLAENPQGETPKDWKKWVFECLVENHEPEQLVAIMVKDGFELEPSMHAVQEIMQSPFVENGKKLREKTLKREWLLNTLDWHQRQIPEYTQPKKVPLPPFQDFLRDYYFANRIGIFTGAIEHWAASKWTFDNLVEKVGYDSMVEVQAGREKDESYEINRAKYAKEMKFGEFISAITTGAASNDIYMTANNHPFKNPAMQKLLPDFSNIGDGYFAMEKFQDSAFLWLGPKGIITPFHHDLTNNFFIQIKGRKRYQLVPPMQAPLMYDTTHVYSDAKFMPIDFAKFPKLKDATIIEVELDEGDCLFIPIGCWHHVEGLSENISMTLINLNANNSFAGFPTGGY